MLKGFGLEDCFYLINCLCKQVPRTVRGNASCNHYGIIHKFSCLSLVDLDPVGSGSGNFDQI
jgi:hypothetical protein